MNERMERVLEKMRKKGIDQLLVSDPLSIRFLTGIMVHYRQNMKRKLPSIF